MMKREFAAMDRLTLSADHIIEGLMQGEIY